ncbi:MAG: hypothetical protein ACYC8V_14570, partial [Caulobacteraceae bacterium]
LPSFFQGISTPSLPAQGGQRRPPLFNILRDIPGPDGKAYFIRAGPSNPEGWGSSAVAGEESASGSSNGGLGDLHVSFGLAAMNIEVGGLTTVLMQVAGFLDEPYSQVVGDLNRFGQAVNAAHITYWPMGANSNAFAGQAVQSLGLPRPIPPVWAPGSATALPVH